MINTAFSAISLTVSTQKLGDKKSEQDIKKHTDQFLLGLNKKNIQGDVTEDTLRQQSNIVTSVDEMIATYNFKQQCYESLSDLMDIYQITQIEDLVKENSSSVDNMRNLVAFDKKLAEQIAGLKGKFMNTLVGDRQEIMLEYEILSDKIRLLESALRQVTSWDPDSTSLLDYIEIQANLDNHSNELLRYFEQ